MIGALFSPNEKGSKRRAAERPEDVREAAMHRSSLAALALIVATAPWQTQSHSTDNLRHIERRSGSGDLGHASCRLRGHASVCGICRWRQEEAASLDLVANS
jgi:hypothetical protein